MSSSLYNFELYNVSWKLSSFFRSHIQSQPCALRLHQLFIKFLCFHIPSCTCVCVYKKSEQFSVEIATEWEDYLNLFFSHWNYKQCCYFFFFLPLFFFLNSLATLSILFAPHHIATNGASFTHSLHSHCYCCCCTQKYNTDISLKNMSKSR